MTETLKLLTIDDDDAIRSIVMLALRLDRGIDVRGASGGFEALKILTDTAWLPDCILLDARMPDVHGRMVFSGIRALDHHRATPIIFLTANTYRKDMADYRALGACGVIGKPFDPVTLASEIRQMLRNRPTG